MKHPAAATTTTTTSHRLCQICNITAQNKKEPSYLKQFSKILKYKNVPK
jgi:hypothetical protein